ncbi:DMT family transporter [Gorillibacterium sp. sgz5001074]|uniref:DMT family transporter n=1 Tax=Gorillibacterium sp. sgz5001074 TaxID=3446695 RepID=UPI003F67E938
MKNRPGFAHLELTASALLIGSSVVAGKLSATRLPVFLFQSAALASALLLLLPLILLRRSPPAKLTAKDLLLLLLQAFLGMFLFRVLLLYGLKTVSAAEAGVITSLTPAMVALLSFLFLKERLNWRLAGGVALSLAGVLVLEAPGMSAWLAPGKNPTSMAGSLLILLAVLGEAMLTVLRRMSSPRVTPLLGTVWVTGFSLILFLPFALAEGRHFDWSGAGSGDLGLVLYYGLFVTAAAYVLWFSGVSCTSAGTAAVYTGFIPVSTLLLSCGMLKEPFSYSLAGGAACVIAGMLLVSFSRNPPAHPRDSTALTAATASTPTEMAQHT